ncbi:glycosyltransferase family 39 protein [bacterium]|nr:glycosyltransferase family 39 protein [bacterium]
MREGQTVSEETEYKRNSINIIGFLKRHKIILIVFIVHAILWGWLNQFVTPHPDYIDHWVQSRLYSLSYYEHPPMAEVLIRMTTSVFGTSEAGFEIGAMLINFCILGFAYFVSVRVFNLRAGIFTLLGLEATLFFMAKTVSIQTEQPLLLAWMAATLALLKYLKTNKGYWLIVVGVFAGIGLLSKYTMTLFYLCIFVYITIVPSRRKEWLNPWQVLGGIVALIVWSPTIYWNYVNDWASFLFQLNKTSDSDFIFGAISVLFLVQVIFAYSCVLTIWGSRRMFLRLRQFYKDNREKKAIDSPELLLCTMTLVPILFFFITLSNSEYLDPQWAVIGIICFFIWLGGESSRLWEEGGKKTIFKVYLLAHIVNACFIGIAFYHIQTPIFPLQIKDDPADTMVGWDKTGQITEEFLVANNVPLPEFIVTIPYAVGAQFAFHLSNHPLTYSLSRVERNLWSNPLKMNKENTLFACEFDCERIEAFSKDVTGFVIHRIGQVKHIVRGKDRVISLYRAEKRDYKAMDPKKCDPRLRGFL